LAGEGAGEEGRRQFVHLLARLRQPLLQLLGQREQARHSPHDFLLLGQRGQRKFQFHKSPFVDDWQRRRRRLFQNAPLKILRTTIEVSELWLNTFGW